MSTTHRPGPLKQQNKTHKSGKHRTKGELDRAVKGKVGLKSASHRAKRTMSKQERRIQANARRKSKREEIYWGKRDVGSAYSAPHVIAVVGLAEDADVYGVVDSFESCDDEAVVTINAVGAKHIAIPRFKTRYHFLSPKPGDVHAVLDAAKVADTILFLYSLENGVDAYGDYVITTLFGHGVPSSIHCVEGLDLLPAKKRNEAKKILQKHVEKRFPEGKILGLSSTTDRLNALRHANEQKRKVPSLRLHRSFLLAEDVSFLDGDDQEKDEGTLVIRGYVRSKKLSVNGLVHLPGWGDFQIARIEAPTDPHPLPNRGRNFVPGPDVTVVYAEPDPTQQESTQAEAVVDPMEGEQTWPTDEEMAEAEARAEGAGAGEKVIKKVPKGTSEYQAAWILDAEVAEAEDVKKREEESDVDDDDEEEEEMSEDDDAGIFAAKDVGSSVDSDEESSKDKGEDDDDEEFEEISMGTDKDAAYDEGLDADEDRVNLEKLRAERKTQEMFPDEVDTPSDRPARLRFAKYRGLKSFRTSEWDPKENLPLDYARIFQFANFERTRKRVLAADEDLEDDAPGSRGPRPGLYVSVHVAAVPKRFVHSLNVGAPLVVFQPLRHEQKMSLINIVLRPVPDAPVVQSKDRLVFHLGFRRFTARPVFSQHTNGTRHKYARFLSREGVAVASFYGPVTFGPASVLAFKEIKDGSHELVASGTLLSVNPDRIVAKRIVLSGHPYRIYTRSSIIRYMFFNREDINWFKPVELRTKWGRRGHIQEPIGTHGHMRCFFDGKLKSQDTVMMNLYKRVFPKWTYNSRVRNPAPLIDYKPSKSVERREAVMETD